MSKAEVERIWLPCDAVAAPRHARCCPTAGGDPLLAAQLVAALLLQHLLNTTW